MNNESQSDEVEFIVSNVSVTVPETAQAGGDIPISFSAEMCVPRYVRLQKAETFNQQLTKSFTQQEITAGFVTISYHQTGLFNIVVSGVNEFGGVYSVRKTINIL